MITNQFQLLFQKAHKYLKTLCTYGLRRIPCHIRLRPVLNIFMKRSCINNSEVKKYFSRENYGGANLA